MVAVNTTINKWIEATHTILWIKTLAYLLTYSSLCWESDPCLTELKTKCKWKASSGCSRRESALYSLPASTGLLHPLACSPLPLHSSQGPDRLFSHFFFLLGSDASASLYPPEPFIGCFWVVETCQKQHKEGKIYFASWFQCSDPLKMAGRTRWNRELESQEPESREKRKLILRWLYCFSFFFTSWPM